jgi:hypothetical protein
MHLKAETDVEFIVMPLKFYIIDEVGNMKAATTSAIPLEVRES